MILLIGTANSPTRCPPAGIDPLMFRKPLNTDRALGLYFAATTGHPPCPTLPSPTAPFQGSHRTSGCGAEPRGQPAAKRPLPPMTHHPSPNRFCPDSEG